MSSKTTILNRIRNSRIPKTSLPSHYFEQKEQINLVNEFVSMVSMTGATCSIIDDIRVLNSYLRNDKTFAINAIEGLALFNVGQYKNCSPKELQTLDIFITNGNIAVAENGAIWLAEPVLGNRLLPFVCNHLIILIHDTNIIADMHQAYHQLSMDGLGYGVFVSGPSKTADIEQSLVIGAQGPKTVSVYIFRSRPIGDFSY